MPVEVLTVTLAVPSLPRPILGRTAEERACEARVFDAWAWCKSDWLQWRLPLATTSPASLEACLAGSGRTVEAQNPSDLVFVFHNDGPSTNLPRELARLHAPGYGFTDEWALAPYAIDDATDGLFHQGIKPRDAFWLAAPSLPALVWGLHDWAHFHNHGPFDEPARTELACDLLAFAWLRLNQAVLQLSETTLKRVAADLAKLSHERFDREGKVPPVDDLEAFFIASYTDLWVEDPRP